jgi:hypothetical protein
VEYCDISNFVSNFDTVLFQVEFFIISWYFVCSCSRLTNSTNNSLNARLVKQKQKLPSSLFREESINRKRKTQTEQQQNHILLNGLL